MYPMVIYRKTSRLLDIKVTEQLHEFGLTPTQFNILDVLYRIDVLTIKELKAEIFASSGNLTVILRNMEKRGLLQKTTDSLDRRKSIVNITSEGKTLFESAMPKYEAFVDSIFSALTNEEKQALIKITKKMNNNLEEKEK